MKKIHWYLECYFMYFKINLLTVMEYKLDFLAINIASILALLVGVFNIEVIFAHVDAMKMWDKEGVLWCLGFFYLVRAVYNTFFQLLSSGRYNAEYPFDEYLVGTVLLVKTSCKLRIFREWADWALFACLLTTGVFAYFSIIFIFSTLSFWLVKSNMFIVMIENLERLVEYPIDIYHGVIRVIVSLLIPIALANYYPTVFMLKDRSSFLLFYIMGICIVLGAPDVIVWKCGMKAYQSTGHKGGVMYPSPTGYAPLYFPHILRPFACPKPWEPP